MAINKRKILFLGEVYRADAQTWINGLKEFGDFDIVSYELKGEGGGWKKIFRFLEFLFIGPLQVRKKIKQEKPDMVIAERTTSYGYLAAVSGVHPVAVAQQGVTDLFPVGSILIPLKKRLQQKAFANADVLHAWGPVMAEHMQRVGTDMQKVMVMPKGIDLRKFQFTTIAQKQQQPVRVIVTRSLTWVYCHKVIFDAAATIKKAGIALEWLIVGDGVMRQELEAYVTALGLQQEVKFLGRIHNHDLPSYLASSTFYVSMPMTEGVSASLFEAMAAGCYPLVTDLPGNRYWVRNGDNGQLIPVNDSASLANKISTLYHQPEVLSKAVNDNRAFIESYANFEVNMKKIADKYHQLIDQYSGK